MASTGARAYNGGLGCSAPIGGPGAEPPVGGQRVTPPQADNVFVFKTLIFNGYTAVLHKWCIITFCASRRQRKMYCGYVRLCVCVCLSVCVCLCVCPRPYAHTTARTRM